ncbi:hypothetical protein NEOLI_000368 [Neolecta irregularis DAH-3]|uniref:Uncharacterized protein n=1 Tax=Neolecta irregularis (strain DAH-3) TaxID=1198029 RepID=A0A1U7LN97_NEOID|nr:hypothetical protein NEOLI_000368 [Neolecta irregularis DAH-3]|eukprot:OLL24124.1 hypothetical protein NEOLI_000368 [Neolecta irregularis DAH-3]
MSPLPPKSRSSSVLDEGYPSFTTHHRTRSSSSLSSLSSERSSLSTIDESPFETHADLEEVMLASPAPVRNKRGSGRFSTLLRYFQLETIKE